MFRPRIRFLFVMVTLLVAASMLLAACNLPSKATPTPAQNTVYTAVAMTLSAQLTQSAQQGGGVIATARPTTIISAATNTPPPTTAASATPTPIPCNRAFFVDDVTIDDGTQLAAGATFTKTWRLKNVGSCTWTTGYVLMFDNGDRMDAPATVPVTSGSVQPGATVDVSVNLKAPATPGTYLGNYRLRSPDNVVFGIGPVGNDPFWVKIVVPQPTATPTATATITPTPTVSPKADLVITSIIFTPATPAANNLVTINITVYNQATTAAGAFSVTWFAVDTNAAPDCTQNVTALNGQSSAVVTCTYTYTASGTFNTKAIVDSANTVAEGNENNNISSASVTVNP